LEEAEGATALVLELVEGETLAHRLERRPLPLVHAVAIAAQIADALDAAHEKGIVPVTATKSGSHELTVPIDERSPTANTSRKAVRDGLRTTTASRSMASATTGSGTSISSIPRGARSK
jgi:serine/threonine protein kinase